MAKLAFIRPTRSIKSKLLILLLGLSSIIIVIISAIAVNSTQNQGNSAQQISSQALRTQAEDYLVHLTQANAKENDLALDRVGRDAQKVASYVANVFDYAATLEPEDFWQARDHMGYGPEGQYANSKDDPSSVFVPNFREVDDEIARDIILSSYLDLIFPPVLKSNPNIQAIYFATPRDVVRYYPNVDLGSVLPPDFRATQRVWYTGSTPENDPEKKPWWTPVYVDATGLGLVTTAASPVYNATGDLIGVVGLDITLDEMRTSIEANQPLQGGYTFLVDKSGRAIALPEQGFRHIIGRSPEPDEVGVDLSGVSSVFTPVLASMMAGESGFKNILVDGQELFVAFAPLDSTGWSLGGVVGAEEVLKSVTTLQSELDKTTRSLVFYRILPISLAIFALVVTVGLVLINHLVNPIPKLAEAAQRIGAGQWDVKMPRTAKDEIGSLAQSFNSMSIQLRGLVTNLEQRVADRTHELERRALQLQTAALVAREAAGIRDMKRLLDQVTYLIPERFGFYHAGIFLVDEANEYAILQAANSEGGKHMLEKGHRLKVGQVGIVGHVAATGEPRIAMNVGSDEVFFNNPDLPKTRSEMALPLKARGRVIGVLDVQSSEISAFSEEDIEVLQILADQVALAIETARLIEESQQAVQELEAQYSKATRLNWGKRVGNKPLVYAYNRLGVELNPDNAVQKEWKSPLRGSNEPDGNGIHQITIPINVRNQTIGTLVLRRDRDQDPWTSEEHDLIEEAVSQIAQALENARLMEENQIRAQHERLIGHISAKAQSSLNLETILKTAVQEIGLATNATKVQIRLGRGELRTRPAGNDGTRSEE